MNYENVRKGVSKIFTGEIIGLFATVALMVTAVLSVLALAVNESGKSANTLFVTVGILAIVSIVLMLVAYIINLVGVGQAAKDEASFRSAFYIAIFGIVFSVLSGFLGNASEGNFFAQGLISMIPELINLIMMVCIVSGILNIFATLHNSEMVGKGETILRIVFTIAMISIVVRAFSGLIQSYVGTYIVMAVLAFSGILSVINYFLYLSYLSKVKKMLAE